VLRLKIRVDKFIKEMKYNIAYKHKDIENGYYTASYIKRKYNISTTIIKNLDKNQKLPSVCRNKKNERLYDVNFINSISIEKLKEILNRKTNYIGKIFGDLKIISEEKQTSKRRNFKVKCLICGDERIINISWIKKHNKHSVTTCGKKNRIYNKRFNRIYNDIVRRCENTNRKDSKYYCLKGIKCNITYQDFYNNLFQDYLKHIEKFGEKNTTIDRIDVNGNYELGNIRWATISEQARNKDFKKIFKPIREKKYGFSMEKMKDFKILLEKKEITKKDLSKKLNVSIQTLSKLLKQYG
jgi:hypothetical protein